MKLRKYFGCYTDSNGYVVLDENGNGAKVEYFCVVGEMSDGSKVYVMEKDIDENGSYYNAKQWLRYTKYGTQLFCEL